MDVELLQHFAKLSHTVNNPLQNIISSAELLGLKVEEDVRSQELLKRIKESARAISDTVKQASRQANEALKAGDKG